MTDYEKPSESNDLVARYERVADEDWKDKRDGAIRRTVGNGCPGCGGFGAVPALNDTGDGLVDIPCPVCT